MTEPSPVVAWRFTDGKPGHARQSEGLAGALAARLALVVYEMPLGERAAFDGFGAWLTRRCPADGTLPAPRLVFGAGRACQWPLLAARRVYGARAVYLMKPALPVGMFDVCIVPRHDRPRESAHVIASEGPLNPVRPLADRDARAALVLLGGPSAHHRWDTAGIVRDVTALVQRRPDLDWQIADSRRTPAGCLDALAAALPGAATCVAHGTTNADWLPAALGRATHAWVTADSMAMLYEALSAGARLGVLDVPARRADRISGVAPSLCARGLAGDLPHWLAHGELPSAPAPLAEAERCAALLLARFPELGEAAR